jgi:hypothetical protein
MIFVRYFKLFLENIFKLFLLNLFMAKKKKRVSAKFVVNKKVSQKQAVDSFYPTAYTLSVVASVIVLIASILFVIFPEQIGGFSEISMANSVSFLGVLDIVIGLSMLMSSAFMKINLAKGNIYVLAFSILALLFAPHGFVIGPLIGIVTSIVVLAKMR